MIRRGATGNNRRFKPSGVRSRISSRHSHGRMIRFPAQFQVRFGKEKVRDIGSTFESAVCRKVQVPPRRIEPQHCPPTSWVGAKIQKREEQKETTKEWTVLKKGNWGSPADLPTGP